MKCKPILVLALLSALAIPAFCGRGFRHGFAPGSGSHRRVVESQRAPRKQAKPAKASAPVKKNSRPS